MVVETLKFKRPLLLDMNNAFFDIDPDDKVPESLKKAIVSEIDTIRNTMELITLYVGNFFNAAGVMATPELPKPKPNQENNNDLS